MDRKTCNTLLNHVIKAIIARGYNPYAQLKGYVINNSPLYITSFKNARELITKIETKYIEEYLKTWENHQDKQWVIDFIKMSK